LTSSLSQVAFDHRGVLCLRCVFLLFSSTKIDTPEWIYWQDTHTSVLMQSNLVNIGKGLLGVKAKFDVEVLSNKKHRNQEKNREKCPHQPVLSVVYA
jgi:hypothetical protein